jgi:hypothetical protein
MRDGRDKRALKWITKHTLTVEHGQHVPLVALQSLDVHTEVGALEGQSLQLLIAAKVEEDGGDEEADCAEDDDEEDRQEGLVCWIDVHRCNDSQLLGERKEFVGRYEGFRLLYLIFASILCCSLDSGEMPVRAKKVLLVCV